jgi:hypothetical protein
MRSMEKSLSLVPADSARRSLGGRIMIALGAVVVALVLIGQGIFLVTMVKTGVQSDPSGVAVPSSGSLQHRLTAVVAAALGESDRGVRRFTITAIHSDSRNPSLRDVDITCTINDDIAAGSVGNGAQTDAYAVFRNVYSAHLPVALVRLRGTYPVTGQSREVVVMRLAMDRTVATAIAKEGWNNADAETVWPLIERQYIAPDFQPIAGE